MSSDIVPWIMYKGRFDADDWFDGLMTSISPYKIASTGFGE